MHYTRNILLALFAVYDKLHQRIKVLNTQTEPSKTKSKEGFQVLSCSIRRMRFKRELRGFALLDSFQKAMDQISEVFWRKEGRRATPQMNVTYHDFITQLCFVQRPLP